MKKAPLKVNDTYEIVAATIFNDYDRKILVRLYQPIIGYEATILFLSLWSELEGDQTISKFEKTHERLIEMMQCNIKMIADNLSKLEAIGLIQTYACKELDIYRYVYALKSPKSPKNFYGTDVLDVLLKNALNPLEYERTRQYFTNIFHLKKDYLEVTAEFCQVFAVANLSCEAGMKANKMDKIVDHNEGNIVLNFDFAALQEKLNDYQVSLHQFSNEEKQIIANLAVAYDISLVDLRTLLLGALTNNNTQLDIRKLRSNVAKFTGAPKLGESKPNTVKVVETGNGDYDKKLQMFHDMTPLEFLRFRSNNQPVLDADAYLVADLKSKTNLSDAVINVVLDYTLQQNENRLPKAYAQKIASSLMRSKIEDDPYQAMIYLNKDYRKVSTSKIDTPTKVAPLISDEDVANALNEIQEIKAKVKKNEKAKL